jgi:hypothetical protein
MKILLMLLIGMAPLFSFAEIITITADGDEIQTAYWPKEKSKAVLIFVPGGDGSFNIASKNPPKPNWILSALYDSPTSPDIVFLDSKVSLGWNTIGPRYTKEHIKNIVEVIKFYKDKTKKPIFLIGHSNGAISLASFLNKVPNSSELINGIIFSGSRNETELDVKIALPVLIMINENDPNHWTRPDSSQRLYAEITKLNTKKTELIYVHGGHDEGRPETSGRHMYAGSYDEASAIVSQFIQVNVK